MRSESILGEHRVHAVAWSASDGEGDLGAAVGEGVGRVDGLYGAGLRHWQVDSAEVEDPQPLSEPLRVWRDAGIVQVARMVALTSPRVRRRLR